MNPLPGTGSPRTPPPATHATMPHAHRPQLTPPSARTPPCITHTPQRRTPSTPHGTVCRALRCGPRPRPDCRGTHTRRVRASQLVRENRSARGRIGEPALRRGRSTHTAPATHATPASRTPPPAHTTGDAHAVLHHAHPSAPTPPSARTPLCVAHTPQCRTPSTPHGTVCHAQRCGPRPRPDYRGTHTRRVRATQPVRENQPLRGRIGGLASQHHLGPTTPQVGLADPLPTRRHRRVGPAAVGPFS